MIIYNTKPIITVNAEMGSVNHILLYLPYLTFDNNCSGYQIRYYTIKGVGIWDQSVLSTIFWKNWNKNMMVEKFFLRNSDVINQFCIPKLTHQSFLMRKKTQKKTDIYNLYKACIKNAKKVPKWRNFCNQIMINTNHR